MLLLHLKYCFLLFLDLEKPSSSFMTTKLCLPSRLSLVSTWLVWSASLNDLAPVIPILPPKWCFGKWMSLFNEIICVLYGYAKCRESRVLYSSSILHLTMLLLCLQHRSLFYEMTRCQIHLFFMYLDVVFVWILQPTFSFVSVVFVLSVSQINGISVDVEPLAIWCNEQDELYF